MATLLSSLRPCPERSEQTNCKGIVSSINLRRAPFGSSTKFFGETVTQHGENNGQGQQQQQTTEAGEANRIVVELSLPKKKINRINTIILLNNGTIGRSKILFFQ